MNYPRKLTRKQKENYCMAIRDKAFILLGKGILTTSDFDKISVITQKALRKIK